MKLGAQLYGILMERKKFDIVDFKMMWDLGYRFLEPCLVLEVFPGYEHVAWTLEWFDEHIKELQEIGFEIRSVHVTANAVEGALAVKRLAIEYGIRKIVMKCPEELTKENLQQTAQQLVQAADILTEVGAEVFLHNEWAEIKTKIDGKTAYEYLLDLCQGKVYAQVDVGWILYGGEDPLTFLQRNAARVKSIHYKDFAKKGEGYDEVTVGTGEVDTPACFRFACENDCMQIVDQDCFPVNPENELRSIMKLFSSLE